MVQRVARRAAWSGGVTTRRASLFCIDSQELVNLVALAMRAEVTASNLRDGIWMHPSTTAGLNEILGAAAPVVPSTPVAAT